MPRTLTDSWFLDMNFYVLFISFYLYVRSRCVYTYTVYIYYINTFKLKIRTLINLQGKLVSPIELSDVLVDLKSLCSFRTVGEMRGYQLPVF